MVTLAAANERRRRGDGANNIFMFFTYYINFSQGTGRYKKTQYICKHIKAYIKQNNTFKKDANEASAIVFLLKHIQASCPMFPEAR